MKYDRIMTEYDEIVGASIRAVAGRQAERIRELNIGVSAAALVLKDEVGKHYTGYGDPSGLDVRSSPRGLETDLKRFFPNIEDRKLCLTWSQVAKLIIDDDFYNKYVDKHTKSEPLKPPENTGDKPAVATEVSSALISFDYSELAPDESDKLRKIELTIKTETASYFTILGANFKAAQELLSNHSGGTFERWYTSMGFKRQTVYNLIQRHDFLCSPTVGEQKADVFEGLPLKLSYEISKPSAPPELVEQVLSGDITTNAEYQRLLAEKKTCETEIEALSKQVKELTTQNMLSDTNLRNIERNYSELEERHLKLDKDNTALSLRVKELESRPVEVAVEKQEAIPEGYVSPEEHRSALEELEKRSKQLSDEIMRLKVSQNAEKTGKLTAQIAELEQQLKAQQNETTKAYGKASKATYDSEMKGKALEEAQQKNAELEAELEKLKKQKAEPAEPITVTDSVPTFRTYMETAYTALNKLVEFIGGCGDNSAAYAEKTIMLIDAVKASLETKEDKP